MEVLAGTMLVRGSGRGDVVLSDRTLESGSLSGTLGGEPSTELSGELRGEITLDLDTVLTGGDGKAPIPSDIEEPVQH